MMTQKRTGTSLLRRSFSVLGLVLLACFGTACIRHAVVPANQGQGVQLSPKLTPFSYFEDGSTLFIAVDTRAARYIKDGAALPLIVGLANHSRTALTFTRESFTLESSDGRLLPVLSVEEYNRSGGRALTNARLGSEFREAMAARFRNYSYIDRQLFPLKGGAGTATDSFELGRLFWTQFYLYFPIPESGIEGEEYNLLIKPSEADKSFVIRFEVR